MLFLIWNSYFNHVQFRGLKISQETIFFNDKFITFLGITTAIVGWLYTVRAQNITNMRNHSINTIMNSRLSEYYNQQIRQIDKIVKDKITFSYNDYEKLTPEEQASITYLLNYYEFIAIGIRYNEFDEEIAKKMMCSQILKTYITFEPLINYFKSQKNSYFENFTKLYSRWKS